MTPPRWISPAVLFAASVWTQAVLGEETISPFTSPRNDLALGSESYKVGDIFSIAWDGRWSTLHVERPETGDLWVTWYNRGGYRSKLKANIPGNEAGSFNWTVNVPNDKIEGNDAESIYVLRMVRHTEGSDTYSSDPQPEMFNSRAFILHPGNEQASVSGSITPTVTPTPKPLDGAPASTNGTSSVPEHKRKSNTAVIAGAIVGSIVGAALILAVILVVLKQKRAKQTETNTAPFLAEYAGHTQSDAKYAYHNELQSQQSPAELPTQTQRM
ncbi:unnamed protein product [Periconia digitata]|uniref:Mid2 domain-containing protein n=1 Tax=Periconia digitata TaxID=1303443 RepID=A0A9W4USL4_9PLEO|nr:unnamed protein product [Periconia digitata]